LRTREHHSERLQFVGLLDEMAKGIE